MREPLEQLGIDVENYDCSVSPPKIIEFLKGLSSQIDLSDMGLYVMSEGAPPEIAMECSRMVERLIMPLVETRIKQHRSLCNHVVSFEFQSGVSDLIFELEKKYGLSKKVEVKFNPYTIY